MADRPEKLFFLGHLFLQAVIGPPDLRGPRGHLPLQTFVDQHQLGAHPGDLGGHGVERIGQFADLVVLFEPRPGVEVALGQPACLGEKLAEGLDQNPPDQQVSHRDHAEYDGDSDDRHALPHAG